MLSTRSLRPVHATPLITAAVTGPVSEVDRIYALDELRRLFERSARPAYEALVRLFSDPTTRPRPVAIADCVVAVDGEKVVVAGAVGDTVGQAVDGLITRLQPGFPEPEHPDDDAPGPAR